MHLFGIFKYRLLSFSVNLFIFLPRLIILDKSFKNSYKQFSNIKQFQFEHEKKVFHEKWFMLKNAKQVHLL